MKKGITLDEIRNAVDNAKSHGIKIAGSFIVGYPTETEDDLKPLLNLQMN